MMADYGEAIFFTTEPARRFVCAPWQVMPRGSLDPGVPEPWNGPGIARFRDQWTHPNLRGRPANHAEVSDENGWDTRYTTVCAHCNVHVTGRKNRGGRES